MCGCFAYCVIAAHFLEKENFDSHSSHQGIQQVLFIPQFLYRIKFDPHQSSGFPLAMEIMENLEK